MDKNSQLWLFGDAAQKERRDNVRAGGEFVAPHFAMERGSEETAAPVILGPTGVIVAADLHVFGNGGEQRFEEIKAKTKPGWRFSRVRWEHGMDLANFQQYQQLEKHLAVRLYVLIKEVNSPPDPYQHCPDNELEKLGLWLIASLFDIKRRGLHEAKWPSIERPGRGGGGWLWPRTAMEILHPEADSAKIGDCNRRAIKNSSDLREALESVGAP